MNSKDKYTKEMKNLVDEISAALKKAAQIVEDTDKNIAGQFRG